MEFRIREARERAGYSQKELAEIIGVAPNTFHGYESGKHDPKSDLLIKIATACNVTTDFLLGTTSKSETKTAPLYSSEAMQMAKDYDSLDGHGQRVVRLVADEELARYAEEDKEKQARAAAVQEQKRQMEAGEEISYFIVPYFLHPMSAGTGEYIDGDEFEELALTKRPPKGTTYIARVSGDSMEPTYQDGDKLFIHACIEIRPGQVGVFLMDGKQWVKELGDDVLISHNPHYEPIPMHVDIRCQGLVLGVCDESYFKGE